MKTTAFFLALVAAADAFAPAVMGRTVETWHSAAKEHANPWKNPVGDGWVESPPDANKRPHTKQNVDGYEVDLGLEQAKPSAQKHVVGVDDTPQAIKRGHGPSNPRSTSDKTEIHSPWLGQVTDGWVDSSPQANKRPHSHQEIDGYESDLGLKKP